MSSSTPQPHRLRYYCHQCDRTVSIPPPASPDDDVFCPLCAGGFVEELLDAPPSPPPRSSASSFDLRSPGDLAFLLGLAPVPASAPASNFNPSNFLHDHMAGILSGGATIQIVVESSSGSGSGPTLGPGDYFMGSGLEQLIQQLAENDPNRYGTPPAAKSAIAALPDVQVSADIMAQSGGAQCAVCMDDFHLGASAKQLPCTHVFHKDCILPWLHLHSSCPVCRFELPTDEDPPTQDQAPGTPSPRVSERRFRVTLPSLPWPLRAAFAAAAGASAQEDASGSGADNDATDTHRAYDDLD